MRGEVHMGKRKRRRFTDEFKAETVRLVRDGNRSAAEVARDLGLAESVVRNWMKRAEIDEGRGPTGALTTVEREELQQLRRENKQLRMEREILKKAAAFFAKENP
jgi:transposase